MSKKRKPLAEINVVPYIDVMLVLLVIFMVTAPLLMQGVKVDLPQTPSAALDKKDEEPVIVSVKDDGTYYINLGKSQEQARPLSDIADTVSKVLRQKPSTTILVWGDTKVEYGVVVNVMTALQKAGASSVGLVTDPPS
ncbi:MAG: protein TolR [Agarilytica sp.]